jgi:hypothetical protein
MAETPVEVFSTRVIPILLLPLASALDSSRTVRHGVPLILTDSRLDSVRKNRRSSCWIKFRRLKNKSVWMGSQIGEKLPQGVCQMKLYGSIVFI